MRITCWQAMLGSLALVAFALAGCGGGGEGGAGPTGDVQGRVANVANNEGVAGIQVTIGGRSTLSTSPGGNFTARGVPVGHHQIIVTCTPDYQLVSDDPVYCDVITGEVTALPAPILVVALAGPPPPPL